MDDATRTVTEADLDALLADIDEALDAYRSSIERSLAMSRQLIELADAIDTGMADAEAELREWF